MSEGKRTVCPQCQGAKTVPGECVCDNEWRGSQIDAEQWEDCHCERELPCPVCHGKGYVEECK